MKSNHNTIPENSSDFEKGGKPGRAKLTRRALLGGAAAATLAAGVGRERILELGSDYAAWRAKEQRENRERAALRQQKAASAKATAEIDEANREAVEMSMFDDKLKEVGLSGELDLVMALPAKSEHGNFWGQKSAVVQVAFTANTGGDIYEMVFPPEDIEWNLADGDDETIVLRFDSDEAREVVSGLGGEPGDYLALVSGAEVWVHADTYKEINAN